MNQSLPQLLKQNSYWETVSVWKIGDQLIEITQTSQGKYLLYKISEDEFKEWDGNEHLSYGLSDQCSTVGKPSDII